MFNKSQYNKLVHGNTKGRQCITQTNQRLNLFFLPTPMGILNHFSSICFRWWLDAEHNPLPEPKSTTNTVSSLDHTHLTRGSSQNFWELDYIDEYASGVNNKFAMSRFLNE